MDGNDLRNSRKERSLWSRHLVGSSQPAELPPFAPTELGLAGDTKALERKCWKHKVLIGTVLAKTDKTDLGEELGRGRTQWASVFPGSIVSFNIP